MGKWSTRAFNIIREKAFWLHLSTGSTKNAMIHATSGNTEVDMCVRETSGYPLLQVGQESPVISLVDLTLTNFTGCHPKEELFASPFITETDSTVLLSRFVQ